MIPGTLTEKHLPEIINFIKEHDKKYLDNKTKYPSLSILYYMVQNGQITVSLYLKILQEL